MLCCTEYSHSVSECGVQNFCIQFVPDMFHFVLISQSRHFYLSLIVVLRSRFWWQITFNLKTKYELDFHFMVTHWNPSYQKNLRACNSRLPPSIVWMRENHHCIVWPEKTQFLRFSLEIFFDATAQYEIIWLNGESYWWISYTSNMSFDIGNLFATKSW